MASKKKTTKTTDLARALGRCAGGACELAEVLGSPSGRKARDAALALVELLGADGRSALSEGDILSAVALVLKRRRQQSTGVQGT